MVRWIVLVVVGAYLASLSPAPVAANPFSGRPDAPSAAGAEPSENRLAPADGSDPGWAPIASVGRALLTFQRDANRMIAQHMRAIRDGDTAMPLLIGIGLAFFYGVIHALGPGHGKLVVMSYFLSRDAQIGRGLLMGLQIAICHVISAMVVVALADLLLRRALGGPPAEVAGVRLASYALIAGVGMVMTGEAIRRSYQRRKGIRVAHACCGHGQASGEHDRRQRAGGERARQGALSLGVGLVPCTGAVLILLYALANDILLAGMLLVAAIAAGMAVTMGALGMVSIVARGAVTARAARADDGRAGTIAVVSEYGGALLITLIGAALCWSAL
jgi:nickel/cobalt transporter (NicO) family protein